MSTITFGILTTTTLHLQGRTVREYLGVVSGDAVEHISLQRSSLAACARTDHLRTGLRAARQRALREMARLASERGATVVIGVRMDYTALGAGRMLVSATGTAVRL
jgi:uncharacterized protein YbjQ (UPF0145 family)